MTQIINLLIFVKELLFNRGKKNDRVTQRSDLVLITLIAFLALSLYGNYVMVKRVYSKTKESIALKNELKELRPLMSRVAELEAVNISLSTMLDMLTYDKFERRRPTKPSKPIPAAPPPSPAQGSNPREPVKTQPIKENTS